MQILKKKNIVVDATIKSKEEAIHKVAMMLSEDGYVNPEYEEGMLKREVESPTNLGNGMAIPHGTFEYKRMIKRSGICILILPDGVMWNDEVVKLVVGIAGMEEEHLDILAKIAVALQEKSTVDEVVEGKKVNELYQMLS